MSESIFLEEKKKEKEDTPQEKKKEANTSLAKWS